VTWSSTEDRIVDVDRTGLITSVGNGTARIVARAADAADTILVAVAQIAAHLEFFESPGDAVVGAPFILPVRIVARDSLLNRALNFSEPVTLALLANPVGGTLDGTTTVTADSGMATFTGLSLDVAGMGYSLRAVTTFDSVTSAEFDIVTGLDIVRVHNGAGGPIGLLLDGQLGSHFLNDSGLVLTDSATPVLFKSDSLTDGEIAAFTPGRPPALLPQAPWSGGTDTVDITFPDKIGIPVTVWIVKGPFSQQHDRAIEASLTTTSVWEDEGVGLEFSEFEIIDATADPDGPAIYNVTTCQQQSLAETTIGKRSGRINIYYVETVDGGSDRGYTCVSFSGGDIVSGGDVIFMAERSGHELLVHELGHSFGLTHIDFLTSTFDRANVMHSASSVRRYFTEGQVFRSFFDSFTALRSIYGVTVSDTRPCPPFGFDLGCPSIGKRLWADGIHPPNWE